MSYPGFGQSFLASFVSVILLEWLGIPYFWEGAVIFCIACLIWGLVGGMVEKREESKNVL